MSDQTKRDLDESIRAHLQDEGQGDVTTAWVLISGSVHSDRADDDGTVWLEQPDGQPRYASLGLLEAGRIFHHGFVYSAMLAADDDED